MQQFCDEAVWLDGGKVCGHGDPRRVVHMYLSDIATDEEALLSAEDKKKLKATVAEENSDGPATTETSTQEGPPADMFRASEGRWGSGDVRIAEVSLENQTGRTHLFQSGDKMTVRMRVTTEQSVDDFVFGVSIFNAEGVCCYGTNTNLEKLTPVAMTGDGEVKLDIEALDLVEGTYKLDLAVHSREGKPYDYHRLLHTFRVKSQIKDVGIYLSLIHI